MGALDKKMIDFYLFLAGEVGCCGFFYWLLLVVGLGMWLGLCGFSAVLEWWSMVFVTSRGRSIAR